MSNLELYCIEVLRTAKQLPLGEQGDFITAAYLGRKREIDEFEGGHIAVLTLKTLSERGNA